MVNSCVAFGCSNNYKTGVSLFKFPRDVELRKKWIQQVKRTRAKWTGPSPHSVLCSEHFAEDSFEPSTNKLGIKKRVVLKKDAVPTIFKRPIVHVDSSLPQKKSRPATACEKLNRARVSNIRISVYTHIYMIYTGVYIYILIYMYTCTLCM